MASPGDVLVVVTSSGTLGLAAVTPDPSSAIVGTWYHTDGEDHVSITFLVDGTYVMAQDGPADPSGQPGVELGTYTWDPATGALSTDALVDTNGEWGMSHLLTEVAQVSGGTLTIDDGVELTPFTQQSGALAIIGGWYGVDPSGTFVVLTVAADGTYLIASIDPVGPAGSGMERGSAIWDPVTGALQYTVVTNTNPGNVGTGPNEFAYVISSVVEGDETDNTLDGGAEADAVFGGGGNDAIDGQDGDDFLDGGNGTDTLEGGTGSDTLEGGAGADSMAGGSGNDFYLVDDGGDLVVETTNTPSGAQPIQGIAGVTDTVLATIDYSLQALDLVENLTLASGVASGTGNGLANEMLGNSLDNSLVGLAGGDSILGGIGNDTLQGNQGADTLRGALGNDELRGGQDNDFVYSGQGNDMVLGAFGADELRGGPGNDTISAGQGNDTVFGGAGEDFLQTRLGNDVATGGAGADTFWFNIAGAADADTILDFEAGVDKIQLDPGFFTDPASVAYDAATGQLSYGGQLIVTLAGNPAFTAADLLFAA
jgi:Ca2+-binding RTX toxin-like protein